jgi:hypothetical protein
VLDGTQRPQIYRHVSPVVRITKLTDRVAELNPFAYSSPQTYFSRVTGFKCVRNSLLDRSLAVHPAHASKKILDAWRRRLFELNDRGIGWWSKPATLTWALNCRPHGYNTLAMTGKPCHRPFICPWCYGRRVTDIVERLWYNCDSSKTYLVFTSSRDVRDPDEDLQKVASNRLSDARWLVSPPLGTPLLGALRLTTAEVISAESKPATVHFHNVVVLATELGYVPNFLRRRNPGHRLHLLRNGYTRAQLQSAVVRYFRYPGGWLWGDLDVSLRLSELSMPRAFQGSGQLLGEARKHGDQSTPNLSIVPATPEVADGEDPIPE